MSILPGIQQNLNFHFISLITIHSPLQNLHFNSIQIFMFLLYVQISRRVQWNQQQVLQEWDLLISLIHIPTIIFVLSQPIFLSLHNLLAPWRNLVEVKPMVITTQPVNIVAGTPIFITKGTLNMSTRQIRTPTPL